MIRPAELLIKSKCEHLESANECSLSPSLCGLQMRCHWGVINSFRGRCTESLKKACPFFLFDDVTRERLNI